MDEDFNNKVREIIRQELSEMVGVDRFRFRKNLQIEDGRNIETNSKTGTKIGTNTDQKLAFYGTTPVDQPATISDPSGGVTTDSEARTAIEAIIDRLQELGLIA